MANNDSHIILYKELRRDIDAIIQRLKTGQRQSPSRNLADHAETIICNANPQTHVSQEEWDRITEGWRDEKHAIFADGPEVAHTSLERSLAITKLQEAVMWLDMDLKAISDENPQPQTGWKPSEALERAWGIIANASGGDWQKEAPEWQDAAARFRDEVYHPWFSADPCPNIKDPGNTKIEPTAEGLKL